MSEASSAGTGGFITRAAVASSSSNVKIEIGLRFKKFFEKKCFLGMVASPPHMVEDEDGVMVEAYLVIYDDKDREHLGQFEIEQLLVDNEDAVFNRKMSKDQLLLLANKDAGAIATSISGGRGDTVVKRPSNRVRVLMPVSDGASHLIVTTFASFSDCSNLVLEFSIR